MEYIWLICIILFKLLTAIGLIALPLFMIGYGAIEFIRFSDPEAWKETEAVIISSIVEEEQEPGNNISYRNRIDYSYSVDGRAYKNSTSNAPMDFIYDKDKASKIAFGSPIGKNIKIFYRVRKPSLAILGTKGDILRLKSLGFKLFVAGLLTAPLGIFLFIFINHF